VNLKDTRVLYATMMTSSCSINEQKCIGKE